MIRLLYLSQASPSTTEKDVQEILASATHNNQNHRITGLLLTGGRTFVQVLEGPELFVLQLYLKIREDRRHGDCKILQISPISARMFTNWAMGRIEARPLEIQEIAELREMGIETTPADAYSKVLSRFLEKLTAAKN